MNNKCGTSPFDNKSKSFVQSAYKEYHNTNIIFSWRIFNYSKLSNHVLYYQLFENMEVKCVFKIFKTQRALYVCLRSAEIKRKAARFCIVNEKDRSLLNTRAQELAEGLYAGDFENKLFLQSSNYLKNDMLTMSFRYADRKSNAPVPASLEEPDPIANLHGFYNDLKHMYLASLNSDFSIHVGNHTFRAHRFVLAIRSKFFDEFFVRNAKAKEYTLEAVPRIMHEVLLYVYSGELKKLKMPCMLEMFDMARMLRIDKLIDKCLHFIAKNINKNNYEAISALATKLDSVDLRNIVRKYRSKNKLKDDITG